MTAPSWVYDGAAGDVRAAAERLGSPAGDALARDADRLVRDAGALGTALAAAVAAAASLETLSRVAADPLGDRSAIPDTTASRRLEASARRALAAAAAALAAFELARRTALADWPHRTAAAEARDRAFDALDEVALDAPDATAGAVRSLRAAVHEAATRRMAALPEVVHATPGAVLPSLVLAYDLYDDVARAAEIARRNAAVRPGFLPARPLEVLSR